MKLAAYPAILEQNCCGNTIGLATVMNYVSEYLTASGKHAQQRAVDCLHRRTCSLASIRPHRTLFSSMRIGWNLRLSTHSLAEGLDKMPALHLTDADGKHMQAGNEAGC